VRLGVMRADAPAIQSTLPVVDHELGAQTPCGTFWHRYSFDGHAASCG
jgi:GH15 family glucan-1,4-alpha-glucosidase